MMDLYDEINIEKEKQAQSAVLKYGGDLFDEAGISTGDESMIRPEVAARIAKSMQPEKPQTEPEPVKPEPVRTATPSTAKGASPRMRRANAAAEADKSERQAFLESLPEGTRAMLEDMGAFESGLVAVGKGFMDVGRGLGLADKMTDDERQQYENLQQVQPTATAIGEVIGQAAPFVPLGVGAGSMATKLGGGVGARMLTGGTVGGIEGGVITKGTGGDDIETVRGAGLGAIVGGSLEAIMPVVGRLGRKVFNKLGRQPKGPLLDKAGNPTPEFAQALKEAQYPEDQFKQDVIDTLSKQREGVDPIQAARIARFKEQGVPFTTGDITQDFADQAAESKLINTVSSEASEPLRQLRLQQSQEFRGAVEKLVNDIGLDAEPGELIKSAIDGRKTLLKKEKNALYKQIAELRPETGKIPVAVDDIKTALPDVDTIDDISITAPDAVKQFKQALARFGIDQSEEALSTLPDNISPQPLTMANFDRFRKLIGNIERSDQTGAIKVLTGPVKNALDKETDLISDALTKAGAMDENIALKLKDARKIVRNLKTEFSPESITGKLINVKRDGVTPVIEASKITQKLLAPNAPVEELKRTLSTLYKSGDKGKQAIQTLKGSVVLNALDDAFKSLSNKEGGQRMITWSQFAKSLEKFDGKDKKLAVLFKGDEKFLRRLNALKQTAEDITPTNRAVPKGSAPVILDLVNKMMNAPVFNELRAVIMMAVRAGADDRAVRKALSAKPQYKEIATKFERDFPAVAAALGIANLNQEEQPQ